MLAACPKDVPVRLSLDKLDFNRAPLLVIWEMTQACALACRHCRAGAMDRRHPGELTYAEGKQLLREAAAMGTPLFIFSGGDPLQRDDLEDLIRHAKAQGLRTGTIPAATARLTRARIKSLKAAGLDQMALSLDGADLETHDAFRGVPGSFTRTLAGVVYAHEAKLPVQINTCFGPWNVEEFDEIADLVKSLDIVFWEVFFLVPTGRGAALEGLRAEQCEVLFGKLYRLQSQVSFVVKITEAPHYRRFVLEKERKPVPHASMGVNAGKGFCFISHTGEVYPSGFLPASGGNVRDISLGEIYRSSPLFRELRDPARLKGRCGRCKYRELCGGSRSRAYAMTGDYLAEEPYCAYPA
jgi:radical SAM protein with 4Fe4S-binding SPASM domain